MRGVGLATLSEDLRATAAIPGRVAPDLGVPVSGRVRSAWWLPPLSEVVFASVLLWLLVGGGQAGALLADGDTGWHIRTGDYILSEHRFPTSDLFSFSRPGAEWFAWEWGSDVLFALLHRLTGLQGVVLLSGALIAATSAALFRYLLWQRVNVIVAVLAMLAAGSASSVHWLARPHLFTYLLFVISLWLLEADRRRPTRWIWSLAPLAALWTNLHGGFVVLVVTLSVYLLGATLDACRIGLGSEGNRPDWRAVRRYACLTLAATAATLLNPYTYRLHGHIGRYLSSDFIRNHVEEFQSPRFRGESMVAFELVLIGGLLVVPRLWRRREYAAALLVLGLAHAALGSVRHVLLYVLAATPAVARELSEALASSKNGWTAALASLGAGPVWGGRDRPWFWPPLWALGAIAVTAVLFHSGDPRWRVDFPREKFPQAALAATEEKLMGHRVFTSDQWADYLIYRYYPRIRVFMDGRSDFYGATVGQQYLDALTAHHRWEEIFEHNGFDAVLLPSAWPLATVLKAHPGWQLDYDDGQALVLRRVSRSSGLSAN